MELADVLPHIGDEAGHLKVRLSNQIIHLLSEQMYSSPLKAIEELVVNAYDANANMCKIGIPVTAGQERFIVVFDDGTGMDYEGLKQLWHVGESPKRGKEFSIGGKRKLIGKFGIGKLATYAIADRITYLSRQSGRILHVTCDYREFKSSPEGSADAVDLKVNAVDDPKVIGTEALFRTICTSVGLDADALTNGAMPSWTLCVLESLKPKAAELKIGRLKWVLRTAMPLKTDFEVWVNSDKLQSAKADAKPAVEFEIADLPASRLEAINSKQSDTSWHWAAKDGRLASAIFPSGISGTAIVSDRSLVLGKSADIERSHGFFIKVRDRLINIKDELFGLHALSHATFNFFRADVHADDLNSEVTAPREGLEAGPKTAALQAVLLEVFNEARSRQVAEEKNRQDAEKRKREHERSYVSQRLVERPIADTLAVYGAGESGTDADDSWFYMKSQSPEQVSALLAQLYEERTKFRYDYIALGRSERLVKFDPTSATFVLNDDHEFVTAYSDEARARAVLEDMATSEVLLEVYMREAGFEAFAIGEVLERRDLLLRSLAQDRVYSLETIAQSLRDSTNDEYNLEVAQVAAARALGFNAKHISKAGEPDGVARFIDFKEGETKITLEAKSSEKNPSLSALDFAGLKDHVRRHGAKGCLLIAPGYVGEEKPQLGADGKPELSAVQSRAQNDQISCWTIEDLARVVSAAEAHQITAAQILDIVLEKFQPAHVHEAVDLLLSSTNMKSAYREILRALRELGEKQRLPQSTRTVQHVSAVLAISSTISNLGDDAVRSALNDMAKASRGMLHMSGDAIKLNGDLEELERRIAPLTGDAGAPRRPSTFRDGDIS